MPELELRPASPADLEWIYRVRHDVYARELGQHPENGAGTLTDALDGSNTYLVAARGEAPVGFVSVTPPWAGRYSVDKYLSRAEVPELGGDGLFEVRILTVLPRYRGTPAATLLMYAALRWIAAHGGRRVVAIGRTDVLGLYLRAGLRPLSRTVRSGAVTFELLCADVRDLEERAAARYTGLLRRLAPRWRLDQEYLPGPDACQHGGEFHSLHRRAEVVTADVLDAWFPPAPAVLAALREDPGWLARSSPPAAAGGLIAAISSARGVPADAIAVGAGSSDLVFRALLDRLRPTSRVLLLDPTYGEYAHLVERVVGCRADLFALRVVDGWRVDPDRLAAALARGYDVAVLVNPNNPTGRHVLPADLRPVLNAVPPTTLVWLDEAYVDYAGPGLSLESYAAASPNTVVCKTMSKVYALSGLRVAYLVGPPAVAARLRRLTPPWQVSLPAQVAAVRALDERPYYESRWTRTHALRADLARSLTRDGIAVHESVANFVLLTLPPGGPTAGDLVRGCRAHGVYLRDLTALSPAFEGRTVRVAVRGAAENRRIASTVADVLEEFRRPYGK
jgi:histidinol-phosphate/aromatic aminotransferase/cobyric acid decarboxylase-like protein/GNAT superfamily N-acetyltransferase